MGQKKDTTTEEENFENNIKTAGDMEEDNPQPISSAHTEPTQPNKASKMISLESIFSSILAGEKEWPMEFFASVKKRFGRMPRGGWTRGAEYFRGKFASNLSDSGFKKVAANASKNNETMNSEEEKTKRRKMEDGLPDESGLSDARLYNNLRDLLSSKMKSSKGKSVESAERTRKIPFEKVDHQVIEILNTVVGAYVNAYPMSNMTDLARILQAVQACYQETTSKSRARSSWKSNIEKKIGKLQSSIELIDKKIGIDRMATEETKAARKVMRQFNLVLDKPCDRTEAKAKLCESILLDAKDIGPD